MIRDTLKQLRPDSLVVEMCDDRYERWLADVVSHPNYDSTISHIHELLDKDPEKLKKFSEIDLEDSNMEYLVGIDYCAYRLPCKMVLGDRSYFTTKKRYEGKVKMLDVYKEALELNIKTSGKRDSKAS